MKRRERMERFIRACFQKFPWLASQDEMPAEELVTRTIESQAWVFCMIVERLSHTYWRAEWTISRRLSYELEEQVAAEEAPQEEPPVIDEADKQLKYYFHRGLSVACSIGDALMQAPASLPCVAIEFVEHHEWCPRCQRATHLAVLYDLLDTIRHFACHVIVNSRHDREADRLDQADDALHAVVLEQGIDPTGDEQGVQGGHALDRQPIMGTVTVPPLQLESVDSQAHAWILKALAGSHA